MHVRVRRWDRVTGEAPWNETIASWLYFMTLLQLLGLDTDATSAWQSWRVYVERQTPCASETRTVWGTHSTSCILHEAHGIRMRLGGVGCVRRRHDTQVRRWKRQYDASAVGDARTPAMAELAAWLLAHVPPEPRRPSVIHGDYRCDATASLRFYYSTHGRWEGRLHSLRSYPPTREMVELCSQTPECVLWSQASQNSH